MTRKLSIIHIDNNKADIEYARQIIQKHANFGKITFFSCTNFSDFSKILSGNKIDIIITDLNIPGISGIEVIKFTKEAFPEIPIIVLTGTGNEELAVKALHLGASDYITKKKANFEKLPLIIEKTLEAEQLKKEKEEKTAYFKTLTEALPEAIIDVKLPERKISYASKGIEKIFGYKQEEVLGKSTVIFFKNKKDYLRIGEEVEKTISSKKKIAPFRTILKKKDGTLFFAEIISTFQYEEDKVIKVIDIVRDVTEEETYKKELVAERNKYRTLFESSQDTILILDNETIIDCNYSAEKLFECKKEDIIGKTPADFSPDKQINGESSKTLATKKIKNALKGKPELFEWIHKTLDGKEKICEVSLSRFKIEEKYFITATVRDKTENKSLEIEIRKQRDRLKKVISLSPAIVYIVDPKDLSLKWYSENMEKILGYSDKEIGDGKKWWYKHIYPEDLKRDDIKLTKIFKTGKHIREYRFYKKNGKLIWIREEMILHKDEQGKPKEIIGAWINITNIKEKEIEIENRKRLLEAITNNASEAIILLNKNGDIVFWNKTAEKIFGYKEEEVLFKTPHGILSPQTISDFVSEGKNLLTTGNFTKNKVIYNHTAQRKDGEKIQTEITLTQFSLSGEIFVLAIIRDISEKIQMEQAIKMEKEKFELTVKSISDAIISVDKQGKINLMNPVAENLLGVKLSKALGKEITKLISLKEEDENSEGITFKEILETVLNEGKEFIDRNKVFSLKGKKENLKLSLSISPLKEKKKILGAVIVMRDITDRIKYQQDLAKISKLEAINTLAGGIAHDFNNILTSLYGYLDMAKNLVVDNRIKKYIEKSIKSSDRARALANRLLTLSKTEKPNKMVQDITESILDTVSFCLSGSKIIVNYQIDKKLPLVDVDKNQIEEVIENIVINASQAMGGKGKLTISADKVKLKENEIGTLPEGEYVRISIADTGPGIPEKYLDKIFEPFFTTKPDGNGLGLATCFSIIKKHGGWIDVKSKQGKGTTFHIYLPSAGENNKVKKPPKDEKNIERTPLKGTILIMDDEEDVREVFKEFLFSLGYNVVETKNGEEALEFFEKKVLTGKIHLKGMIFDLTVRGGMGGKETCEKIREKDKNIPIIVVSGFSEDPIISEPAKYGFNAGIAKPVSYNNFAEIVKKVFEN